MGSDKDQAFSGEPYLERERSVAERRESAMGEKIDSLTVQKEKAYQQRNEIVIYMAKLALANGMSAGWGTDGNEDWDDEWRTVVYVETEEGQVCWHMSPDAAETAKAELPEYGGKWDETWYDTHRKRMLPSLKD